MAARLLRGRSAKLNFPGERPAPVALPRGTAEALLRASKEAAIKLQQVGGDGGGGGGVGGAQPQIRVDSGVELRGPGKEEQGAPSGGAAQMSKKSGEEGEQAGSVGPAAIHIPPSAAVSILQRALASEGTSAHQVAMPTPTPSSASHQRVSACSSPDPCGSDDTSSASAAAEEHSSAAAAKHKRRRPSAVAPATAAAAAAAAAAEAEPSSRGRPWKRAASADAALEHYTPAHDGTGTAPPIKANFPASASAREDTAAAGQDCGGEEEAADLANRSRSVRASGSATRSPYHRAVSSEQRTLRGRLSCSAAPAMPWAAGTPMAAAAAAAAAAVVASEQLPPVPASAAAAATGLRHTGSRIATSAPATPVGAMALAAAKSSWQGQAGETARVQRQQQQQQQQQQQRQQQQQQQQNISYLQKSISRRMEIDREGRLSERRGVFDSKLRLSLPPLSRHTKPIVSSTAAADTPTSGRIPAPAPAATVSPVATAAAVLPADPAPVTADDGNQLMCVDYMDVGPMVEVDGEEASWGESDATFIFLQSSSSSPPRNTMSPDLDIATQQQLEARQVTILSKIDQLTDRLAAITAAAQRSWLEPSTSNAASRGVPSGHASQEGSDDLKDMEGPLPGDVAAGDETATQTRLADAIRAGGITRFRFRRVPSDYYDWTLEARRDVLGAPSVDHLCKSIVMTNTQAPADVVDCSNPRYSKYYVIVIQYSARLNAEKVRNFVYALNDGTVPRSASTCALLLRRTLWLSPASSTMLWLPSAPALPSR
ncbi:unnamed protein product [Closterium sp. Naga37s-1]|nr:unnamed protein product [Closterium sp. Naga37s-1]